MKKILCILLLLSSPILAQENNSEENNTDKKTEISKFDLWKYNSRGYNTKGEFLNNYFLVLSIAAPSDIVLKTSNNKFYRIGIEFTLLDHHNNGFYFTFNVMPTFLWNDYFIFGLIFSMGFGGTFFDSRDELGKGWLVGVDWESGLQVGYAQENQDDRFNYFTGINIRGLYRSNTRLGLSIAFQILYHYYPKDRELLVSERHEISIGPKIGIIF